MATLRIQHVGSRVLTNFLTEVSSTSDERAFSFQLSPQDAQDIRWYLEDYPIYPTDPQPKIAQRIERRMAEAGRELFRQVLARSEVWAAARHHLSDIRIEIETEVADALVPWELMREPVSDLPLALNVRSFIRCHSERALRPNPPKPSAGKIRILLAICRPSGADDVPFRSVARHLIRGLNDAAREPFYLEVLRPPTFEQLSRRLLAAKAQGDPFHAVHFDGHGLAGEIYFENPRLERNAQPIKAAVLGKLLHDANVPLLILNACRSADNEPPEKPPDADLHQQIRQFGSFAHAVMDYGATGVLAWRYSVFVDAAAQYMLELYSALASGLPLGEAATLARKQLSAGKRPIEDWTVPIVFEALATRLFPRSDATLDIKLTPPSVDDSGLPHAPDIGFVGRDETVLKLDRTFDDQNILLLHAYAGSGKTSTAVEFVRWYQQTEGLSGPVLFTSFEQLKTLPRVLDELGRVFEGVLSKNGIQWLTLTDPQRREIALQILRQIPVFWIWDNVEPIGGFPAGTQSAWSAAEQKELADFLRAARETKAKFLLTSRRDERDWLHDLPARIELPAMPFDERVQMTEALAKKLGRGLDDVDDWRPLLRFTQGNPLTLTVLVGQALRDGLKTRDQIANFVRDLQSGEAVFEDEASEGRARSLAASLEYGFDNAFTETERKQLALLHLFQGFVDIDAVRMMADITREAGIALLDRAAEIGLLTALGGGYYTIHPALPWFLHRLFEQYYSETRLAATRAFVEAISTLGDRYHNRYGDGNRDVIDALAAEEPNLLHARSLARSNRWWRPVTSTMQGLRSLYDHTGRRAEWARLVEEILPDFVDPQTERPLPGKEDDWSLVTEYRVRLAREARHWDEAERLQRGLVNWRRQRVAGTFAEPQQQRDASKKNAMRNLAAARHDLSQIQREHGLVTMAEAQQAWDASETNAVRNLAISLYDLAQIQREQGMATCVDGYREALSLADQIKDSQVAASCMFNLGNAFKNIPEIRDLALAEQWYQRSLDMRPTEDRMGRAKALGQLGNAAYERFFETEGADERRAHLSKAAEYYQQSLSLTPNNAPQELAIHNDQLGSVFDAAGQADTALHHYRESIRYKEAMQDRFGAGTTRLNAAIAMARAGRLADARDWAAAALRDFHSCDNAAQNVIDALKLLEAIECGFSIDRAIDNVRIHETIIR